MDLSATSISICHHKSRVKFLSILQEIHKVVFEAKMAILQVKGLNRERINGGRQRVRKTSFHFARPLHFRTPYIKKANEGSLRYAQNDNNNISGSTEQFSVVIPSIITTSYIIINHASTLRFPQLLP